MRDDPPARSLLLEPRAILARAEHRPWPLPRGPWVMAQRWHELLFAHWPVAPEVVRPLVPAELELDLQDGRAWIGVVPFRMSGVRLRGTPALPWLSRFPELNVRTYVRQGDRPGVWFFSLDATQRLAVRAARAWFQLPYFDAEMALTHGRGWIEYRSRRTHRGAPPAELRMRYRPSGGPSVARPGTREHFLAERYCLYARGRGGALFSADIHHPPWELQAATAEIEENTMAEAAGVPLPESAPHLLFARTQDVLVWRPHRVAR